jgi:phospholipase/carboxylesterase
MLDGPRLAPASGAKPRSLVVLLHGYGSNGDDLISLAPLVQHLLPDAAFVAPNAPARLPHMAMPFNGGQFAASRWKSVPLARQPRPPPSMHF